ncbi:MAG: hypothetical protein ACOZBZ_00590 [Patescibacteria group bacterium]
MKKDISRYNKPERSSKTLPEDILVLPKNDKYIAELAKTLSRQIDFEIFKKRCAPAADILKLVGLGAFLAASIAIPNLPIALKPFLVKDNERDAWKRFNIPYLKRTIKRLEKQKLVEIEEEKGMQVIILSERGKKRILKYSLEEIEIKKPKLWDGFWRLVSYDIPDGLKFQRRFFHHYLLSWGFYPLHESSLLHAYPCEKEVEFLREYLGIGEYVRIFRVSRIENDKPFREFFGI